MLKVKTQIPKSYAKVKFALSIGPNEQNNVYFPFFDPK